MKTLLLAGGYGTRLKPITNSVPKCLVPIRGTPLLEIWLRNLRHYGFGPFLINTHYLSEIVERHIQSKSNEDVYLSYEEELLGTAGTLFRNLKFFLGEDCLLVHADNLCNINFDNFLETHRSRPKDCLLTMLAFRTENPSSCGIIELDHSKVVTSFIEKPPIPKGNLANGAIYLLSKEFLDIFSKKYEKSTDFSLDVIPDFIGRIYCYETNETLLDIGTPEAYEKAQTLNINFE